MFTTIEGISLKIIRAQEHVDSLNAEIATYLATDPYEIVVKKEGHTWECFPIVKKEPPPRLSAIVGDCATNLLAPLDYIIWRIAGDSAGMALVPGRHRPHFPIMASSADFHQKGGKVESLQNRYSIPASTMGVIESVQPYNAGYSYLGVLHHIANKDKHRAPNLTVGVASRIDGATAVLYETGFGYTEIGSGLRGDHVTPIRITDGTGDAEMDVKGQVTGFVTLDDAVVPREFVVTTLKNILETIRDRVVPAFRALIS